MDSIPYTTLRANLADQMDRVCEDHVPLVITRKGSGSVVMMSLADYESIEETNYLLRSPNNARRLLASIARLRAGEGIERELFE